MEHPKSKSGASHRTPKGCLHANADRACDLLSGFPRSFEGDLVADQIRKGLQDARVLGKDVSVFHQYGFDPSKALGVDPICFGYPPFALGHLRLKRGLSLNERCLILNQGRYRVFQATVAMVLRSRHVVLPRILALLYCEHAMGEQDRRSNRSLSEAPALRAAGNETPRTRPAWE